MAIVKQLNPEEYSPARKKAMEEAKADRTHRVAIGLEEHPDFLGDTLCCPGCGKKRKIGKAGMRKMFEKGLLEKYKCQNCRRN